MNRKTIVGIVLTLMLVGISTLVFSTQNITASGTIYIRSDGSVSPDDGRVVTEDKIRYYFNQALIQGSIVVQRNNIVVDGMGHELEGEGSGTGINLTSVMGITIKNVTIKTFEYNIYLKSSSYCSIFQAVTKTALSDGICLSDSSNNNITGNNATNSNYGISLFNSSNNTVTGNTVTNNNNHGIYLSDSSGNIVTGNNATTNVEHGIVLYASSSNNIAGNTATNNEWYGIVLVQASDSNNVTGNTATRNKEDGIVLWGSSNNKIAGNTATNNGYHGILLYASSNYNIVTGNTATNNNLYGIYLWDSSNLNTVTGNTATNNDLHGIVLYASSSNNIAGNIAINDNYGGILLWDSSDNNTVAGNTVAGNTATDGYGILLDNSSNDNIYDNEIAYNNVGIGTLGNSSSSHIYRNNFVNNVAQSDENGLNFWDDGSEGNYWSDYEGADQNGDGIGDTATPHHRDRYPLIVPVGPIPVFYQAKRYDCLVVGNVTVCQFSLDNLNKTLSFKTIGYGWVNLTVPKELIGGTFRVFVNNTETLSFTSWNKEHTNTSIYFECKASGSNNVRIEAEMKFLGDINGDGIVNIVDITIAATNFGKKIG